MVELKKLSLLAYMQLVSWHLTLCSWRKMGVTPAFMYAFRVEGNSVLSAAHRIEVSQSRDILTSHMFRTPYWRSILSLPGTLSYGAEIVKVPI